MSALALADPVVGCLPRWAMPRRLERPTYGSEVAEIAHKLGTPLLPWQAQVLDVGLEWLDGKPAYRHVTFTVPRQNGKTSLLLALAVHRAIYWSPNVPQRIYYSAQTGQDGRQKVKDDWVPLLEASPFIGDIRQILRGTDQTSIIFLNGSRFDVMASGIHSGHGKTVDLAIIDEAFKDEDDRREQAMIPAMKTRRLAQLWVTSTAGHEGSVYLKRKVDAGRAAATEGLDHGLCYFEWSADPEAPIDDPAIWHGCMPALGHLFEEDVIQSDLATLPEGDFRRADLNQWTVGEERIIPADWWNAIQVDGLEVEQKAAVFGVDVAADRDSAAIVAADGQPHAELVEHREGLGWLVERVVELAGRYGGESRSAKFAIDTRGPAAAFIDDLKARGVRVVAYDATMMAAATARLYDAIADPQLSKLRIARHPALDWASAGAVKRVSGDLWYFSRVAADVDVSPLLALTLAYDLTVSIKRSRDVWIVVE